MFLVQGFCLLDEPEEVVEQLIIVINYYFKKLPRLFWNV